MNKRVVLEKIYIKAINCIKIKEVFAWGNKLK